MRWMQGVFVGKLDHTDEFLLLTPSGAMKTRCVRRLEGDNAWDLQFLNLCVGSPWNATGKNKHQGPTIHFTLRLWSVTQATVSLPSAESEAKAITKGCIEALYVKHLLEHQTARTFKIAVWTDSSSVKAIMQKLGPGRRAKHLEAQTLWVQQLAKIGLVSLNKVDTLENVADVWTKHVPRAVLDKLAGMMGYTFLGEETAKFQAYTNITQNYWNHRLAAVEKLLVFDDEEK